MSCFTVSDAFGLPTWLVLDSAQKCDGGEACWPPGTWKQGECGQAEPEPFPGWLSLDSQLTAHAVCRACFQESGTRQSSGESRVAALRFCEERQTTNKHRLCRVMIQC